MAAACHNMRLGSSIAFNGLQPICTQEPAQQAPAPAGQARRRPAQRQPAVAGARRAAAPERATPTRRRRPAACAGTGPRHLRTSAAAPAAPATWPLAPPRAPSHSPAQPARPAALFAAAAHGFFTSAGTWAQRPQLWQRHRQVHAATPGPALASCLTVFIESLICCSSLLAAPSQKRHGRALRLPGHVVSTARLLAGCKAGARYHTGQQSTQCLT